MDVTFTYKLLNLNLQDAFHLSTCLHLFVTFEILLTWLDSQMDFFQQGTFCSQSDGVLLFSQSHDCSPMIGSHE